MYCSYEHYCCLLYEFAMKTVIDRETYVQWFRRSSGHQRLSLVHGALRHGCSASGNWLIDPSTLMRGRRLIMRDMSSRSWIQLAISRWHRVDQKIWTRFITRCTRCGGCRERIPSLLIPVNFAHGSGKKRVSLYSQRSFIFNELAWDEVVTFPIFVLWNI